LTLEVSGFSNCGRFRQYCSLDKEDHDRNSVSKCSKSVCAAGWYPFENKRMFHRRPVLAIYEEMQHCKTV